MFRAIYRTIGGVGTFAGGLAVIVTAIFWGQGVAEGWNPFAQAALYVGIGMSVLGVAGPTMRIVGYQLGRLVSPLAPVPNEVPSQPIAAVAQVERSPKEWQDACREWLLGRRGYRVQESKMDGLLWSFFVYDEFNHEIAVAVEAGREHELGIGWAYTFEFASGVRESQDLADELLVEMARQGMAFRGLKAPMTKPSVSTAAPLASLTEHEFLRLVDKALIALEAFSTLVERAKRTIVAATPISGPTAGVAAETPQPQVAEPFIECRATVETLPVPWVLFEVAMDAAVRDRKHADAWISVPPVSGNDFRGQPVSLLRVTFVSHIPELLYDVTVKWKPHEIRGNASFAVHGLVPWLLWGAGAPVHLNLGDLGGTEFETSVSRWQDGQEVHFDQWYVITNSSPEIAWTVTTGAQEYSGVLRAEQVRHKRVDLK